MIDVVIGCVDYVGDIGLVFIDYVVWIFVGIWVCRRIGVNEEVIVWDNGYEYCEIVYVNVVYLVYCYYLCGLCVSNCVVLESCVFICGC